MTDDKNDELIYDLLGELAGIDTHDTNLRDAPAAYVAVYDFIAELHWGGCACRWDREDKRTATCERHQGWLDVVHEWSERAKSAEWLLESEKGARAKCDAALKDAGIVLLNTMDGGVAVGMESNADNLEPRREATMIPIVEDILKALQAGDMPLSQAMLYIARHLEIANNFDASRLMYVMEDIDGFCNIDDDKQEVAYEVAVRNGREAPNTDDRLEGARLLIDRAMGVT